MVSSSRFWVAPFLIGVILGSVGGIAVGAAVAPPVAGQFRRLLARLLMLAQRNERPIRFDLLVQ